METELLLLIFGAVLTFGQRITSRLDKVCGRVEKLAVHHFRNHGEEV